MMTFRDMRRMKQQLTQEECIDILKRGSSGVLAVLGDDDYPYAVPLSYVYDDSKIYFHSAKVGHKIDALKRHEKVSFCVIDQDQVVPQEYTTYFRSVIVFGKAHIMNDDEHIRQAIIKLAKKYAPHDTQENRNMFINKEYDLMSMVEIDIDHMSGKEAIELVRAKNKL